MKIIYTWNDHSPAAKKELTPQQVEAAYLRKYPELKNRSWYELVRAVVELPCPTRISKEQVWKYLVYVVVDCGFDLKRVWIQKGV